MSRTILAVLGSIGCWGCFATLAAAAEPAPTAAQVEFFEKKIRPVLIANCIKCHGPEKHKGGLRLDTQAAMRSGGDSGPAMIPGKPKDSQIIHAVLYTGEVKMPPSRKLPDNQIADLTNWIKQGAFWPAEIKETRVPETGKHFTITDKDRAFWSFQPIRNPAPPSVRNPSWPKGAIDHFVLAGLESNGIAPVTPADKPTLLRRASFDLTGLPPTIEEMDEFLRDSSPDAFARAIDRLLASPHYGERWARHWLDVARYGEDQAHTFAAKLYPYGYRYRDWVVKAFNDDLPYDRFIVEQIAGDLIDGPNREERLMALGYFALGPVYYGGAVLEELDDRVDTLSRGFLGLTVACARCHDHKFDPISSKDYYSLAGIFSSTQFKEYPLADPKTSAAFEHGQAAIKTQSEEIARFITAETLRLSEAMTNDCSKYMIAAWKLHNQRKTNKALTTAAFAKQEKLADMVLDRWVNYLFPKKSDQRPHLADWLQTIAGQDANKDLSKDAAALAQVAKVAGAFQDRVRAVAPAERTKSELYRQVVGLNELPRNRIEKLLPADAQKTLAKKKAELEKLKKSLPVIPVIHSLTEKPKPANMRIHVRGNPATQTDEAPRGFPGILSKPNAAPFTQGSGRLELARAIASKDNPLTARVLVNRIWLHHFGRGIVGTPSNFGHLGERPTHPQLLDYLASRFIANGWSIKALHREIMLSATYQLSSKTTISAPSQGQSASRNPQAIDADNKLLWHMNRRRLEVESWRDAMLSVSGNLDRKLSGPSINLSAADNRRRTIYASVSRHNLDPLLRLFDFPDPNLTNDRRPVTTVPLQQLFVLNSDFMIVQAKALAGRLTAPPGDDAARIRRAFTLVYGRPAHEREIQLGLDFLKLAAATAAKEKSRPKTLSPWEQYAQVLLGANEFAYVD